MLGDDLIAGLTFVDAYPRDMECKGNGIHVIKITFSDPTDNFFDFDEELHMGEKQVLKCSNCNHGYVKNY